MQANRSRTIAALAAFIATAGASIAGITPAHAGTYEATAPNQVRQAIVSLRGVTLASPEGIVAMDRRIRAAARHVCGPVDGIVSQDMLSCRRAAIADARSRLSDHGAQRIATR